MGAKPQQKPSDWAKIKTHVARKLNQLPTDMVSMKQGCCSAATFIQGRLSLSRSPASAFRHETEGSSVGKKDFSAYVWVHVGRHVSAPPYQNVMVSLSILTGYSRILSVRDT